MFPSPPPIYRYQNPSREERQKTKTARTGHPLTHWPFVLLKTGLFHPYKQSINKGQFIKTWHVGCTQNIKINRANEMKQIIVTNCPISKNLMLSHKWQMENIFTLISMSSWIYQHFNFNIILVGYNFGWNSKYSVWHGVILVPCLPRLSLSWPWELYNLLHHRKLCPHGNYSKMTPRSSATSSV